MHLKLLPFFRNAVFRDFELDYGALNVAIDPNNKMIMLNHLKQKILIISIPIQNQWNVR